MAEWEQYLQRRYKLCASVPPQCHEVITRNLMPICLALAVYDPG